MKKAIICSIVLLLGHQGALARFRKKRHQNPLPKVFAVTIPKSGTHMMAKCLKCLTGKDILNTSENLHLSTTKLPPNPHQELYRGHLRYSPEAEQFFKANKFKCFLMLRDPRDQVVSMTYWIVTRPEAHPIEAARYKANPAYFSEVLMERIKGINDYYKPFIPWLKNPLFYTVKFENLVGDQGGGKEAFQVREIKNMARHLNRSLSVLHAKYCAKRIFGGTATFRKGKIGSWKKHFTQEHKKAFKEGAGKLLIDLGYAKDFKW